MDDNNISKDLCYQNLLEENNSCFKRNNNVNNNSNPAYDSLQNFG